IRSGLRKSNGTARVAPERSACRPCVFWKTASISCWLNCLLAMVPSSQVAEQRLLLGYLRLGAQCGRLVRRLRGQVGRGLGNVRVANAADLYLQGCDLVGGGVLFTGKTLLDGPVVSLLLAEVSSGGLE